MVMATSPVLSFEYLVLNFILGQSLLKRPSLWSWKHFKWFYFDFELRSFFHLFSLFLDLPMAIRPLLDSLSMFSCLFLNFFLPSADLTSSKEKSLPLIQQSIYKMLIWLY